MRKRLLLSVAFGAVGLTAALPIGDRFGLSNIQSLVAFTAAGLFLGYLLSVFLDVFLTPTSGTEN
jgi:hypothetical protein